MLQRHSRVGSTVQQIEVNHQPNRCQSFIRGQHRFNRGQREEEEGSWLAKRKAQGSYERDLLHRNLVATCVIHFDI